MTDKYYVLKYFYKSTNCNNYFTFRTKLERFVLFHLLINICKFNYVIKANNRKRLLVIHTQSKRHTRGAFFVV